MSVDGKDFGKKIGRVDEAREKDKTEELLADPLLEPIKSHVDRLRLLRRPIAHSLSTNRRGG